MENYFILCISIKKIFEKNNYTDIDYLKKAQLFFRDQLHIEILKWPMFT